ncbi:hypothetical protein H6P81_007266 [Aristolochia fimbriata]|uniref:Uncharacterized protein n=1 Tax=Aristolochia fimbriata TaxID=158543 RepID=A0AAV7F337_ARIFI|nr:hypothetical protein H6P81_007266 [Aristolochia fimbriata]
MSRSINVLLIRGLDMITPLWKNGEASGYRCRVSSPFLRSLLPEDIRRRSRERQALWHSSGTMERKVLLVCVSVGFLGLLAAALGFAAEAKRVKVSDVELTSLETCKYPRSPALGLGFTAALSILMAQIIINTAAGCICCNKHPRPSSTNWTIAFVSFVVSWVTFIIAFLLLLTGAALNDQHGEEQMYFGSYCYVVKAGVFAGGSILSMASVCLGIIYYLTLLSTKTSQEAPWGAGQLPPSNQGGIALGQPQFPPPPLTTQQQPIFVPEDTYNRQQI